MRAWSLFAISFLSACSTGSPLSVAAPQVLSSGDEAAVPSALPGPGGPVAPDALGHEGFAILLNDERAEGGVRAVMEHPALSAAAQAHARDMVDNDYLAHIGQDGRTPGQRALAAGYDWDFIAENIAQGYTSDVAVIDGWMGSPGHRANMLDDRAEDFGLGLVDTTWVLMLGREHDAAE